jgi:glycosyltransferase involved in cell wall biosynthesis
VVRSELAWFQDHGWTVTLASAQVDDLEERVWVAVPTAASDIRGMLRAARRLADIHQEFRADLVHCHGLRSFGIALLAGLRPAATVHGVGPLQAHSVAHRFAKRLAFALGPHLALAAYIAAPRLLPPRWQFVPHAADRLRTLRQVPFVAGELPTFLWLGRLATPKRPDVFIEALALASRVKPVRGIVAGSGPFEDGLREVAHRRGLDVRFVGHVDDVSSLLRESSAVVVLSWSETIPHALQEAMWIGRAVISSPLPGPTWLVGDAGILVDNPGPVSEAMLRLADPASSAALGESAATRIRQLIEPDDPWPAIERRFVRILEEKSEVATSFGTRAG